MAERQWAGRWAAGSLSNDINNILYWAATAGRGRERSQEEGGRGYKGPWRPGGQFVRRFQPEENQEEVDIEEAERTNHGELSQFIPHWPQTESLTSEQILPSNPSEPSPPP